MACRAVRLFAVGFTAASLATATARAGDLTIAQAQTITIPKRTDAAGPPAAAGLPPTLGGGLTTGAALTAPATRPPAVDVPLSRLSLENLSLVPPPPPSTDGTRAVSSGDPSITQQGGHIQYNVIPNAGFTPYLGLGAGRAAGMLGNGTGRLDGYGADDGLHSYQGLAGFAYRLDKDTRLDLDYRMSTTQRPNVPMLDNANVADSERDRAAILSLHYDLDPVLRAPPR